VLSCASQERYGMIRSKTPSSAAWRLDTMPATIVVTQEERPALLFALARAGAFYAQGTAEQRESAASLRQMLAGLEDTPEATVEVELLTQDAYLLGIRLFFCEIELEEYWLDAIAPASGGVPAGQPDGAIDAAVRRYFADVAAANADYSFDPVRGLFTDLGMKLDAAVTEASPRARAIYNSDREEMSDKATELQERNARLRAAAAGGDEEPEHVTAAVATVPAPAALDWGVDVPTGLAPDDIPRDSFRSLTVGSVHLFVTNYGGVLGAVGASCPHQQTALLKGRLTGTVMECPRHGAQFDLRDGRQLCPPFCEQWMQRSGMAGKILSALIPDKKGGDLPRYPLHVEDGEIVLRI
jgi:nitrite reductase/ring-hydroxylating ferredoxin subunit